MKPSTTRRSYLLAAAGLLTSLAGPTPTHAGIPKGWGTFKGVYFEIGVPPGFVARPINTDGQVHAVVLVSNHLRAEFMVFSPLWTGEAPFKQAGAGEKLVSRNVKKAGKNVAEDLSIEALDGSYTRYVICQSFVDEANAASTDQAFGLKLYKGHSADYKPIYAEWKKTLTRFGD